MKHSKSLWSLALLSLFCFLTLFISSCAKPTPEVELIPREILFGNPEKVLPRISPDGTMMAYLAPVNDVLNVWVKTIGQDDDRAITKDTDRGIRRFFWAQDNKQIMYLQDVGGNENWRLYGVTLETEEIRDLTPYEGVQVRILEHNKHFPNDMLIEMNKENPQLHDVYNLNLETGDLKLVARNPGNIIGWKADPEFKVRCAMGMKSDGGMDLMIRETEKSSWKTLLTWGPEDSMSSGPAGFTKDGQYMYCTDSRNANASRLVKIDLAKGELMDVIAEDPQYDVSGVMIHPDTYEVQAVAFTKARDEWIVLDESIKADFEAIANLDKGDYFIYDRDNADDTWLVGFTKDDGPVPFYAYDRGTKQGTFLFDHRPDLNDYTLAAMEPISFPSRDEMTIHGYITYPIGKEKKNLPMVLNVHGGPWYRDTWGYNPEAQWLANRGYVCLQVNFRGSTGYGKDFLNAGNKEWGGKMHHDLVDGVNWAINQGIADPKKIAIYGGSYGGYAALVGATFTPDLFTCSVDIVGPSNLITWMENIPPYWIPFKPIIIDRVGDPEREADFLKSRSPLFKVDQIRIPMLIAQGANDPRVPQAESDQVVQAMKDKGLEVEYMVFEDEGHGFAKPENRLEFYAAAEKFLAKHLGGRYEEGAPEKAVQEEVPEEETTQEETPQQEAAQE